MECISSASKSDKILKQLEVQTEKMESLIQQNEEHRKQNEELKQMMLELQSNPRLLVVCNHLHSLEGLDLNQPQFGPVLEILEKELPAIANLANEATARVHAKAVYALNMIRPSAIQTGGDVYFKQDNLLAKDTENVTTKAFIYAMKPLGHPYIHKAISDMESQREADSFFAKEILSNAAKNAIPAIEDIEDPAY